MRELSRSEQEGYLPRVLPAGWELRRLADSFLYDHTSRGVRVMANVSVEDDDKRWMHISVSRRKGDMPTYALLVEMKDLFAGREALALQILPPQSEHYTSELGVDVAHLWVCLDGRPVPDFKKARGGTL